MAPASSDRFFLGAELDPQTRERTDRSLTYDPDDLVTHGVIVGMTGSGKTGLGVVLLEEALLAGIPCLVIDPKGDLGNLALTFPELQPAQFEPWVDAQQAAKDGRSVADAAASAAADWGAGLASWGIDGTRIRALHDAAPVTLYTPGSTAGVGLDLVGSLQAPPEGTDPEAINDEIESYVSGLLALAGIEADPLTSPEHILLTNLIADAWAKGRSLDLVSLLGLVQDPPLRKLGVLDLDTFFPPKDRMGLLIRLNGLLASPSFQAWSQGVPLDLDAMLHMPDGRPRAAVVALSHLGDSERQFVVTLLLSRLVTWMRRQSGTTALRTLVYMDEVFGFVPPNGMPPAKKPILTILKQARAFGVGMVLSTQNPVDLDYKALSNAGTWMVGRLQTERDKARLMEGLTAAAGTVDVATLDGTISALGKRQFVLQRAGASGTTLFTSRWAMSYLRGPLDRDQIARLSAADRAAAAAAVGGPVATAATTPTATTAGEAVGVETAVPTADVGSAASSTAPTPAPTAADEVVIAPPVTDELPVCYPDPAAPWIAAVGGSPGSARHAPALVASVELRFDDTRSGLDERERWEAVLFPLDDRLDWSAAIEVDHDPRDFRPTAPEGIRYALPAIALDRATFARQARKRLVDHLRMHEELALLRNNELGVLQRPQESEADFRARVDAAADARSDEAAAVLRAKLAERATDLQQAIADAQQRVDSLAEEEGRRRAGGLVKAAGGLIGALLGGRRSSRSLARSIGNAAGDLIGGSGSATLDNAQQRVGKGQRELGELEAELAGQLLELDRKWDEVAGRTDSLKLRLTATDITVGQLTLCWIPVAP